MAKTPKRFHFLYAERMAWAGYAVRRVGWAGTAKASNWLVYRGGLWLVHVNGEPPRVVEHDDFDREDMLARDWTIQAPTCAVTTEAGLLIDTLDAEEVKELARVQAFPELITSGDPLGTGCALPPSVLDVAGIGKYATGRNLPTAGRSNPGVTYPAPPELSWGMPRVGPVVPHPDEPFTEPPVELSDAPILSAASQPVSGNVLVTFADDADWRAGIIRVRVFDNILDNSAWSTASGVLTLNPANSTLLQTARSIRVRITAIGYYDAEVTFTLTAGPAYRLIILTQPAGLGVGSQNPRAFSQVPVLGVGDAYGNRVQALYTSYNVTATKSGVTTGWALERTEKQLVGLSMQGPSQVTFSGVASNDYTPVYAPAANGFAPFRLPLEIHSTTGQQVLGASITFSIQGLQPVTSNTFTVPAQGRPSATMVFTGVVEEGGEPYTPMAFGPGGAGNGDPGVYLMYMNFATFQGDTATYALFWEVRSLVEMGYLGWEKRPLLGGQNNAYVLGGGGGNGAYAYVGLEAPLFWHVKLWAKKTGTDIEYEYNFLYPQVEEP